MLFVLVYQSSYNVQFTFPYGIKLVQTSENANITDSVLCNLVLYQLLSNGTVQARGRKDKMFQNIKEYEFVNVDIIVNASQLYCYMNQTLWYVTKSGEVYVESTNQNNHTVFNHYITDQMPQTGIKQIIGDKFAQFVLTNDGLYFKGLFYKIF
ncbi:Regulator_of chromosome condensation 1/beta-lactamase-inhibitor protein II [Hexamita inflata]|uniref:Regulator of chromosome condensation 1/beta-lactamase-inhibitor protein II n=1 Tax=Hexamita inflata TaxID=28002 RepID=A0AA86U9A6_9EUKA|nr:Regulator of chromosome condensation 1/beta-lactamase-inhibitor protein II [Hexamita inflata]